MGGGVVIVTTVDATCNLIAGGAVEIGLPLIAAEEIDGAGRGPELVDGGQDGHFLAFRSNRTFSTFYYLPCCFLMSSV